MHVEGYRAYRISDGKRWGLIWMRSSCLQGDCVPSFIWCWCVRYASCGRQGISVPVNPITRLEFPNTKNTSWCNIAAVSPVSASVKYGRSWMFRTFIALVLAFWVSTLVVDFKSLTGLHINWLFLLQRKRKQHLFPSGPIVWSTLTDNQLMAIKKQTMREKHIHN